MKKVISTIVTRWRSQMPLFFKWVVGIGTGVASVALAVQMALTSSGAIIPEWWNVAFPYLIGVGAGMTATAKLTQKQ